MSGEFFTIPNLLIAVVIVVAMILIAVILSSRKHPPSSPYRRDKKPAGENKFRGEFSPGKLLEIRVLYGAQESLEHARKLEEHIVTALSSVDKFIDSRNQQQEQKKLQESLDFLERYIDYYCAYDLAKDNKKIKSFLVELRNIREAESIRIPPLYRFLLELSEYLESDIEPPNFQSMVAFMKGYDGKFKEQGVRDPQMKLLISCLSELTRCSEQDPNLFSTEFKKRQKAIHNIIRIFQELLEQIRRTRLSQTEDRSLEVLPEIAYLNGLLNKLLGIAREETRKHAEKLGEPIFELTLLGHEDELLIEHDYITLKFRIKNTRHDVLAINKISIFPVSHSTELEYKNSSWKDVSLKNGQQITGFDFRTFVFQTSEVDKNPIIEFKIKYWLENKQLEKNVNYTLPELHKYIEIANPFEEGTTGTALSGNSSLFVGRQKLLRNISRDLLKLNSVPHFCLIVGLTRTGKSSILKQFAENPNWLKRHYIIVEISPQHSQNLKVFFHELYLKVKDILRNDMGIYVKTPDEKVFKEGPQWQLFIEFLRLNEEALLEAQKRILFLVDEYQEIASWDRPDSNSSSNIAREKLFFQFPEFIKVLRDEYGKIAVVLLAGYKTLQEIENYNWVQQLGGRIETHRITNLEKQEADELIQKKMEQHSLEISNECLERIRLYTNCHPFLHMLMGYFLFEEMLDEQQNYRADPIVHRKDVDAAALQIEADHMKFIWADPWIQSELETQILLYTISELSYKYADGEKDLIKMPLFKVHDIDEYLFDNYDIPFKKYNFDSALSKLRSHNIVEKIDQEGRYKLLYPLFAINAYKNLLLGRKLGEVKKST